MHFPGDLDDPNPALHDLDLTEARATTDPTIRSRRLHMLAQGVGTLDQRGAAMNEARDVAMAITDPDQRTRQLDWLDWHYD
ncbi:hypothetical protein FRAHR75_770021 [Frankia sp. Hr75.2]|nr:hypothetical protein FRAHR75_770021 [Frankia sp. Hr75.2]